MHWIKKQNMDRQKINLMLLYISNRTSRKKRIKHFAEVLRPTSGMSILDLGGFNGQLLYQIILECGLTFGRWIVADIDPEVRSVESKYRFESILLQEGEPLPFKDKEIDITWCNSVIEHLTPEGDEIATRPGRMGDEEFIAKSNILQRKFASEICRVSKSYYIQTPHRAFPIELHTGIPLLNFLPHNQALKLVNNLKKFWFRPIGYVDWNLLSVQEMKSFFPTGMVEVEMFMGIPKSIIAWKKG